MKEILLAGLLIVGSGFPADAQSSCIGLEFIPTVFDSWSESEQTRLLEIVFQTQDLPDWTDDLFLGNGDPYLLENLVIRTDARTYPYAEKHLIELSAMPPYEQCTTVYLSALGFHSETLQPPERFADKFNADNVFCHCQGLVGTR
jgi:hypothetical protein